MTRKALSYLTLCALALGGCTPRYANGKEPKYGDRVRVMSGFYEGEELTIFQVHGTTCYPTALLITEIPCAYLEPIK